MANSITHQRKIIIYAEKGYKDLVVAECAIRNETQSAVVSDAIKQRYDTMSEDLLNKIKAKAEALAKYPKR